MVKLLKWLVCRSRSVKRNILILADALLIIVSIWVSFSLRLGEWYWPTGGFENMITWLILVSPIIAIPIFNLLGFYRFILSLFGTSATWSVLQAVSLFALLWGLLAVLSGVQGIPRSVVLINLMVALISIGGFRFLASWVIKRVQSSDGDNQFTTKLRVLIFGAGEAGRQLAVGLSQSREYQLYGFIDDKKELHGRDMMGVPILPADGLTPFLSLHKITDLLLAIPSISRKKRNIILERLHSLPVRVRTLPGLVDLAQGRVNLSDLQELEIDDILLREVAKPDEDLLKAQVSDQIVLVTGAGGSIGSEICRQVLKRHPKILLLLELSEYALYTIQQELQLFVAKLDKRDGKNFLMPRVIPMLGSVQDERRLSKLMQAWKPEVIYHAAAYKHVPIVEHNLAEGIKNNVFGTLSVAKVAFEKGVSNFVFISTDKAVNPTNGMGASKRVTEMALQALAEESRPVFESLGEPPTKVHRKTHLSMVRFGNVLGSSGSVVPLFQKQINHGGPITLSHEDITRYFMTIPEAAQLVMQAGTMSGNEDSAEVFVLDMGEPVRIIDLARRMVLLSGLKIKDKNNPEGDIAIEITGLRPGEKLYEELLFGDNALPTQHPRILKANEEFISWDKINNHLKALQIAAEENDVEMIRSQLKQLVKGYQPDEKVVDWIYMEEHSGQV